MIEYADGVKCVVIKKGCSAQLKGKPGTGYPQIALKQVRNEKFHSTSRRTKRKAGNLKRNNGAIWRVRASHLAYYRATQQVVDPPYEISHLCHNTKCVNAEHLICERHKGDWNRIHCGGPATCIHDPKCLRAHTMSVL